MLEREMQTSESHGSISPPNVALGAQSRTRRNDIEFYAIREPPVFHALVSAKPRDVLEPSRKVVLIERDGEVEVERRSPLAETELPQCGSANQDDVHTGQTG